ncbi:MAG: PqqD family protein [Acidobacteriota bacterium]
MTIFQENEDDLEIRGGRAWNDKVSRPSAHCHPGHGVTGHNPERRPDVQTRSGTRHRLLYDGRDNVFHELNETAEFIWNLCDGLHSLDQMEQAMRQHFDVPSGVDIRADIQRTLKTLEKRGLLLKELSDPEN